ncbi:MAG: hypothetical protein Fur0037_00680 [Planctomycetota bacterium]
MRILLVSHHAPPHIGGVEEAVLTEATALVRQGHRVVWVASDGGGGGKEVPPIEGLELIRVRAWHVLERWFHVAYPLFSPRLLPVLRSEVRKADAVHLHGLVFPGSLVGAFFARRMQKPCVVTDHGGLLRYRFWPATALLWLMMQTLGRYTARRAARLVAINEDLRRLLVRLGGDPDKVVFESNPIDRSRFHPPSPLQREEARRRLGWDGAPRVLLAGRLLPHKGIDVLLEGSCEDYRLVFCGPGDPEVLERIRRAGAEHLGARPQEELVEVYWAADAFALPSRNEGFPLAVMEALACGLPVVTTASAAYEPYRDLPRLAFCEPDARSFREALRAVLRAPRSPGAAADLPDPDSFASRIFAGLLP